MSHQTFSHFIPIVVLVLSTLAGFIVSHISPLYAVACLVVVSYLTVFKVKSGLDLALFIGALMVVSIVACDYQNYHSTPSAFVKTIARQASTFSSP